MSSMFECLKELGQDVSSNVTMNSMPLSSFSSFPQALLNAIKQHLIERGLWNHGTAMPTTEAPPTQPSTTRPPSTQPLSTTSTTTAPSTTTPSTTQPSITSSTTEPTATEPFTEKTTTTESVITTTPAPVAPVFYPYGDTGSQLFCVLPFRFFLFSVSGG